MWVRIPDGVYGACRQGSHNRGGRVSLNACSVITQIRASQAQQWISTLSFPAIFPVHVAHQAQRRQHVTGAAADHGVLDLQPPCDGVQGYSVSVPARSGRKAGNRMDASFVSAGSHHPGSDLRNHPSLKPGHPPVSVQIPGLPSNTLPFRPRWILLVAPPATRL